MNPSEEIVRCWLNEKGFFTRQNMKVGLREIDILAMSPKTGSKMHVECKVLTNPIGSFRLRGPMRYSKLPLSQRVQKYVEQKFERVADTAAASLGSRDYGRLLVLGELNPKFDDWNALAGEFRKFGVKLVSFSSVVGELVELLGPRRRSDLTGLYVQLLARREPVLVEKSVVGA